ncbi:TRAP transporter small permease subunit [Teredinibacter purpureus]|jgi:TRAP-type mannitol/chloroaromatic compound transport system, small permease component|uniref:TRAP transporter small permease subunit n=1 Tax=Teredinibacter purpureus TaxID=2731756 RepID=UPI0005F8716B|nr:TRAP transporter small permease subunit [Teredinibacter purpureus]
MIPTDVSTFLLHTTKRLDAFSLHIGRSLAWLTALMVALVALIVALRAAGIGSIALQESVTYLHATVLMLCLGYNLQQGGHVRVDVFYGRFNPAQKAWVDALGGVFFLLPFSLFLVFTSLNFVSGAWQIGETSADPGGLPLVFLLKTLIPISGILLALQGLSEVLRALSVITWLPANHSPKKD